MSLPAGTRLGPYEIVAAIGAGGMGEVYRAKDTRLDRPVAIKVLPQHLSSSPEIRQRFEREAKTISQLSHSHICALYDVGNQDGVEYLVMELLEGETLSDRLGKGALPLEQTLRFGTEIADALDKAHRQGIVHRDLKPGNVMLTKSGVKLLDFGLAKAMAPPVQSAVTSLPTVMGTANENLTQEGTILGTFQYMAPEQLEGREADARTDIFAFGCVLYEMATGRKAFMGASQASLISSIMKEEPAPISTVSPMAPPALERVVKRCLSKDPEDRWQNAADLKSELKWIAESGSQSGIVAPVGASGRRRRAWLPWAAALAAAALAFAGGRLLRSASSARTLRATVELPPKTVLDRFNTPLAMSPDGSRLVVAAAGADGKQRLWMRPMDALEATPIPGTEDASYPFWSPDGRFIGFFAEHKLKKVPAAGGAVLTICDAADGRGASWGPGDIILFAPAPFSGLSRVSAAGGAPAELTKIEKTGQTHRLPFFLPDGKHALFYSGSAKVVDKENGIFAVDIDSKKITLVTHENSEGRYADPEYLLFYREGNLMAQPMDAGRLKTTGEAVPIAEKVQFSQFRSCAAFSFSRTGLLVFQFGAVGQKRLLTWFDLDGKRLGVVGGEPAAFDQFLSIAPDGQHAAAAIMNQTAGSVTVWTYDLVRGVGNPLTPGSEASYGPVWSPDGRSIAYGRTDGSLIVRSSTGSAEPKVIVSGVPNLLPTSWSPDGRLIAFRVQDLKTGGLDMWVVPADGSGKPSPFLATSAGENFGSFSPDGRWFAYVGDDSGRPELYVTPFPGPGERRQVSTGGAIFGLWLGNGREILYAQPPDSKLFATELETKDGALQIGATRPIFGGQAPPRGPLGLTADGKRILIAVNVDDNMSSQMTLVTNWAAELERK